MRKGLLAGFLVLFALWFVVRAVPFLDRERPAISATPTVQPTDPTTLAPIAVKGGQSACADQIPWGPDARYVQFTVTGSKWPPSPVRIVATGPGYRAVARLPEGAAGDVQQTVAITPARTEIPDGSLCVVNEGRHQIKLYGINQGRGSSPSTTTVGRQADRPRAQRHAAHEPVAVAHRSARDDRVAHRGLPPADGLGGLLAGVAGGVRRAGRGGRGAGPRGRGGRRGRRRPSAAGRRARAGPRTRGLSPARGRSSLRSGPRRAPR